MSKKQNDMADAVRYLTAQLESDLYLGMDNRRNPEAGLMTLLAKLGIKSAMLDNRPLSIKDILLAARMSQISFGKPDYLMMDADTLKAFKKLKK
jgi:hypothetical protein